MAHPYSEARVSLVPLSAEGFLFPTPIDGIVNVIVVFVDYSTDEEHLDVMLNGDQLRVVYTRLPGKPFAFGEHFDFDSRHAGPRLTRYKSWLVAKLEGNSVFFGLDSSLPARLASICKDRARHNQSAVSVPCVILGKLHVE